jgi:protein-arginine kinase activator protein McsA
MTDENSKNKKIKNNHSSENDDYESQITNLLEQINNYVSKGEYDKAEKLKKQIEILKKNH